MAIDIGDAVLTFLGDTTQLDQSLNQVATTVPAKMGPATEAIQGTSDAVSGMTKEMAVGQQGAVELGNVVNLAGETSRESMYQARGELGLLGEQFGVTLPRHVRSFIAELPGVGTALSAAFSATAILFIIEAVIKVIEKIHELASSGKEIEEAWDAVDKSQQKLFNGLEDNLLRAQGRTAELTGNYLEALRLKLELINNQSLGKLDSELEKLGQEADAAFAKMDRNWFGKLLGLEGSEEAKGKFDEIKKSVDEALSSRTPEAFADAMKIVDKAIDEAGSKVKTLTDEQKKLQDSMGEAGDPLMKDQGVDPRTIESWQKLGKVLQDYRKDIDEAHQAEKEEATDVGIQERNRQATEAEQVLKRQAQGVKQEADIEQKIWDDHYKEAVADLQQSEKEKIDATKQGSQARLAAIDAAIKEEESKGLQDTGFYRSLQEQRVKFVEAALDTVQKAANAAAAAALKTAETEAKVETATVTAKYSEQEKAVTQLGSFKLLSAQQTSQRLVSLYNQENSKLLGILNDLLKKEQDAIKAAQAKLDAAKNSPFGVSPQQIEELKKLLQQAEQAEAATQVKISATNKQFRDKQLTLDKGYYGQALALATAAGNQQLALDLKQHQAALIAIQDQIALTKARGGDVTQLKAQEHEIQNTTNALVKEATQISKLKQAWDIFSADFAKSAKTDETTAQQMAQSFTTAAQGMETGIQAAFSAMVTGTESAGKAMEKAMFSTIGKIAEQWGAYYIARGIADAFDDPPAAAAEFAAGAALEALGGVLSGLGSASSGSSSGGTSSTAAITPNASTATAQQPVTVTNVPKLSGGGLITHQTLAIVGDSPGGGDQREAVIPLNDAGAMREIMQAFAGASGGAVSHNYYINGMVSTTDLTKLTRMITRSANTGRVRMTVTNSARVTKRS